MNTHNQSPVAEIDQPEEEAVVGGSSQGCYGIEALVSVLALVHPLRSRLGKSVENSTSAFFYPKN